MTATRMTRRKATRRPRRSSPNGDRARLVALHPSSKATSKPWLDPLSRPPNTRAYPPAGRPCQFLPPKSTIATMSLEANSP
jgi:hypothetical protein